MKKLSNKRKLTEEQKRKHRMGIKSIIEKLDISGLAKKLKELGSDVHNDDFQDIINPIEGGHTVFFMLALKVEQALQSFSANSIDILKIKKNMSLIKKMAVLIRSYGALGIVSCRNNNVYENVSNFLYDNCFKKCIEIGLLGKLSSLKPETMARFPCLISEIQGLANQYKKEEFDALVGRLFKRCKEKIGRVEMSWFNSNRRLQILQVISPYVSTLYPGIYDFCQVGDPYLLFLDILNVEKSSEGIFRGRDKASVIYGDNGYDLMFVLANSFLNTFLSALIFSERERGKDEIVNLNHQFVMYKIHSFQRLVSDLNRLDIIIKNKTPGIEAYLFWYLTNGEDKGGDLTYEELFWKTVWGSFVDNFSHPFVSLLKQYGMLLLPASRGCEDCVGHLVMYTLYYNQKSGLIELYLDDTKFPYNNVNTLYGSAILSKSKVDQYQPVKFTKIGGAVDKSMANTLLSKYRSVIRNGADKTTISRGGKKIVIYEVKVRLIIDPNKDTVSLETLRYRLNSDGNLVYFDTVNGQPGPMVDTELLEPAKIWAFKCEKSSFVKIVDLSNSKKKNNSSTGHHKLCRVSRFCDRVMADTHFKQKEGDAVILGPVVKSLFSDIFATLAQVPMAVPYELIDMNNRKISRDRQKKFTKQLRDNCVPYSIGVLFLKTIFQGRMNLQSDFAEKMYLISRTIRKYREYLTNDYIKICHSLSDSSVLRKFYIRSLKFKLLNISSKNRAIVEGIFSNSYENRSLSLLDGVVKEALKLAYLNKDNPILMRYIEFILVSLLKFLKSRMHSYQSNNHPFLRLLLISSDYFIGDYYSTGLKFQRLVEDAIRLGCHRSDVDFSRLVGMPSKVEVREEQGGENDPPVEEERSPLGSCSIS